MLTPFYDDRSIDWNAVDDYADWLIELGSAGLFAVALSSEMYDLSESEREQLTRRVVARARGRVPVVASSPTGGSPEAQADAVAQIAGSGVSAVVLISNQLAPMDASDRDVAHAIEVILDRNPGVSLGLYECPQPFKRLLSLPLVRLLAESGAFTFFKDTSHCVPVMAARLAVMEGSPLQLYNAAIGSLPESLRLGAAGLSGYAANIYPDLVAWLCQHHDDGSDARSVHQLLTVAEHAVNLRYPTSAKYFLQQSSRLHWRAISRWKPEHIGPHEGLPLQALGDYIRELELPSGALSHAR